MRKKKNDALAKQLYKGILSLETMKECENFCYDLLTMAELEVIAQRLEVARMLEEGATYGEVEKQTGASTATISRVKKFLFHGKDGYLTVLKKLKE